MEPTLFIIYINDISNYFPGILLTVFAKCHYFISKHAQFDQLQQETLFILSILLHLTAFF